MSLQKTAFLIIFTLSLAISMTNASALINVVAAENIYGEVAKELGGPYVKVTSILNNPSQDPHLFTTTPSTAIAVSKADIVIYNGSDYDPWMKSILSIKGQKNRQVINVSMILDVKAGDNPHIWYSPETIPLFAKTFTQQLVQNDPAHKKYFEKKLNQFNSDYKIIYQKVEEIKKRFRNTPVIATEPLFGYMSKSLGLQMHAEAFQKNIMNDVPPSVSDMKSFEDHLRHHSVRVLIYNKQVMNPLTEHMRAIAIKEKIPVQGVSELMSPEMTYIQWIMKTLNEFENALVSSHESK